MRSILVVVFIASYQFLNAQLPMIDAGPADTTTCPPGCIDLVAVYEGGGGNTSDYDISVIPFAPDAYAGTLVPLSDDDVSPLFHSVLIFASMEIRIQKLILVLMDGLDFPEGLSLILLNQFPPSVPVFQKTVLWDLGMI